MQLSFSRTLILSLSKDKEVGNISKLCKSSFCSIVPLHTDELNFVKSYYTLVSSNFVFQNIVLGPASARVCLIVNISLILVSCESQTATVR